MKTMIEFMSGSGILSKTARERGWKAVTVDLFQKADIQEDILTLDYKQLKRGSFDYVHFSPVCKYFSMASLSHHTEKINDTFYPKTVEAFKGYLQVLKAYEILMWLKPKFWSIENPKATIHKLAFMNNAYKKEVWYCRYGDKSAKPTNIFTNININFKTCSNGNPFCHHERAPRGSKTGTQGKKGSYERAMFPKQLCEEILDQIEKSLKTHKSK